MRNASKTALALLAVFALLVSAVPHKAAAIPYRIEGYLRDSEGLPITLANISISGRYYNSTAQGFQTQTYYATTDINGYFRLYVAAMEPGGFEEGTEMTVAYRSGGRTVSKVVTVGGMGAWANLTSESSGGLLDAIASPIGLITIVLICAATFLGAYLYHAGGKDEVPPPKQNETNRVERRRRR